MKLEFHPQAEMELIEEAAYYELQVTGLGERFADEVQRATEVLLEHPTIGALADSHIRKFVLNRFPFTLYYSVAADILRIEVVAHQRRRPGYWQARVNR